MKVCLTDAKNALFRYGWVHRLLTNSAGVHTGCVYGLLGCMLRLKKAYPDTKFVFCWDGDEPNKSWRHALYPGYKHARNHNLDTLPQETKDTLAQIGTVKQMITALGISQISVNSVEADDVIGIMAMRCLSRDWTPIIYSSDCDFLQFVTEGALVIRDVDKSLRLAPATPEYITERYRCQPEQMLTVRAFCGDTSDCIVRAVPGVGEVHASRIVAMGADATKDWKDQPWHVRNAWGRLATHWPTVQLNHRLMRIARSHDEFEDKAIAYAVRKQVERALSELDSEERPAGADYQRFVAMLGELELQQAMKDRADLWKLQRVNEVI